MLDYIISPSTIMPLPLLNLLIFAFTTWLGLYLVARDRTKPVLVYTGLGLVAYASEFCFQFPASVGH